MGIIDIILIGVALSMDAFAVSVCKGLTQRRGSYKNAAVAGAYFGFFQALMPVLGYLLGSAFANMIAKIDHWIVFIILSLIGGNMIREAIVSLKNGGESTGDEADFSARVMLPLAVATSIDALAVGVSFSFMSVSIVPAAALIGCTTFAFGFIGVKLGSYLGAKFGDWASIAGGAVLIIIGLKILLEHLGMLPF